jgi:hypothetical protein
LDTSDIFMANPPEISTRTALLGSVQRRVRGPDAGFMLRSYPRAKRRRADEDRTEKDMAARAPLLGGRGSREWRRRIVLE